MILYHHIIFKKLEAVRRLEVFYNYIIFFKIFKVIMVDQDEFLIWKSECEEVGLETDNNKALLEDVGLNADLYIGIGRGQHTELGVWPALSSGHRQMMKL